MWWFGFWFAVEKVKNHLLNIICGDRLSSDDLLVVQGFCEKHICKSKDLPRDGDAVRDNAIWLFHSDQCRCTVSPKGSIRRIFQLNILPMDSKLSLIQTVLPRMRKNFVQGAHCLELAVPLKATRLIFVWLGQKSDWREHGPSWKVSSTLFSSYPIWKSNVQWYWINQAGGKQTRKEILEHTKRNIEDIMLGKPSTTSFSTEDTKKYQWPTLLEVLFTSRLSSFVHGHGGELS